MTTMSEEEMLSQQEIDALLKGDDSGDGEGDASSGEESSENTLTDFERDAVGEIGNITFGSASTALSTILGHKVEITTPEVELVPSDDLKTEFPKPHAVVSVDYTEGFSGTNMFVMKMIDAAIIADLMMGGDGQAEDDTLSDLHTSAVQEAMNQMMGSAATSMSNLFDMVINISPPTVEIIDFGDSDKPQQALGKEMLVKVAFRLTVGDLIDSYIMQLLPLAFAKEMTASLTDPSSLTGQPASAERTDEEETRQETAAAAETAPAAAPSPDPEPAAPDEAPPVQSPPPADRMQQPAQPEKEVQAAEFVPLMDKRDSGPNVDLDLFMDIPLSVTVELGRTEKSIQELLSISPGAVIELDKMAGEPVDILVNQKRIARGEVVVVDENFGVRVTEIYNEEVRLTKLR